MRVLFRSASRAPSVRPRPARRARRRRGAAPRRARRAIAARPPQTDLGSAPAAGPPPPPHLLPWAARPDRKSVVEGKSVSVRVDLGGPRILKKKKKNHTRKIMEERPT